MSSQYLVAVEPSYASFGSASSAGFDTCHLYAAKSRMSAQLEFILYDLRGWIVSFCTVSISSASSSWSNTCGGRRGGGGRSAGEQAATPGD